MSLVGDLNIEPSQKRKRGRRSKTNPMEGVPTASLLFTHLKPIFTFALKLAEAGNAILKAVQNP